MISTPAGTVLTLNGGSSSLKLALFEPRSGTAADSLHCLYRGKVTDIFGSAQLQWKNHSGAPVFAAGVQIDPDSSAGSYYQQALQQALAALATFAPDNSIALVGHRIVHGADQFPQAQVLTDSDLQQLATYIPLAPLHQPYNLQLIHACRALLPDVPHVGCFDTAFHAGQPPVEQRYAIPREYHDQGLRKYGFHGLSYQFIQQQLQALGCGQHNTIVCHLGSGASLCAIKNGQSIATTMGFSPLDGLPMGTRCGAIDPGVLLYLLREHKLDVDQLENLLYKRSGWLGISGISGEMLTLEQSDADSARAAIEHFCYRTALAIGQLSAALGGLQQLVFTGGVGENDAMIRANILQRCAWLGVKTDSASNQRGAALISDADSAVLVRVIATDEEQMIALNALHCIGDGAR